MDVNMSNSTAQESTSMALIEFPNAHTQLSIVKLSEPVVMAAGTRGEDNEKRISVASSTADEHGNPTPATLEADLKHYQELFTKLRFSYVEQVTKEKFLRAVVGDPPVFVEQADNTAFEAHLLQVKASLVAQKLEVAETVKQLEAQGRNLSRRYKVIELQMEQLQNLPSEIASLQGTLELLRAQQAPKSTDSSMTLPLPATLTLLSERQVELDDLDIQLKQLEADIEIQSQSLSQAESGLRPMQSQKLKAVNEANEAKKRRDMAGNGLSDDIEEKGRWLSGVHSTMNRLLDVQT